jgi:hypothetical protein
MTLTQLRAAFRALIFDKAPTADPFSEAEIDRLLNAAMHELVATIRAKSTRYFVVDATLTPNATQPVTALTLSAPYTLPHRVLHGWQSAPSVGPVPVKRFAAATLEMSAAAKDFGLLALSNETIVWLNAPANATLRLWYQTSLPDMTDAGNTPGQTGAGNTGTANLFPAEWQDLIALKAAVRALKAERGEAQWLEADLTKAETVLLQTLTVEAETSEDR